MSRIGAADGAEESLNVAHLSFTDIMPYLSKHLAIVVSTREAEAKNVRWNDSGTLVPLVQAHRVCDDLKLVARAQGLGRQNDNKRACGRNGEAVACNAHVHVVRQEEHSLIQQGGR